MNTRSGSSVGLEYLPVTQGVAGSSPVQTAIKKKKSLRYFGAFYLQYNVLILFYEKLFFKKSINEYKKIYKEKGFKALLKKLGWKIFLFVFLYYLIRDIFLYIIAPIFLFDFLSKYGFSKISIYAIFLLVFVLFITFLIHSFNKNLKLKY